MAVVYPAKDGKRTPFNYGPVPVRNSDLSQLPRNGYLGKPYQLSGLIQEGFSNDQRNMSHIQRGGEDCGVFCTIFAGSMMLQMTENFKNDKRG